MKYPAKNTPLLQNLFICYTSLLLSLLFFSLLAVYRMEKIAYPAGAKLYKHQKNL